MTKDERVALVDENDNVIGSKWRSELLDSDCWRGVSIWVENDQGQVLIQQRSLSKKNSPGKWTPAADGTIVEGDSYDDTAIRELAEEIGLTSVELIKTAKVHAKYEFGWRQMQGYTAVCNWPIEKFTPQAEEVSQLEWADKKQVLKEINDQAAPTRSWPASCRYWTDMFNLNSTKIS